MQLEDQLKVDLEKIAMNQAVDDLNQAGTIGKGCGVNRTLDAPVEAIKFDAHCIRCVEGSAKDLFEARHGHLLQPMISGAGHDSVFTSKRVPTSMILVLCWGRVSHNPAEYCAPEDCASGAQILIGAMLRYDELRAPRNKD